MRKLALILLLSLSIPACGPFRLQQSIRTRPGDWPAYGGGAGRTGVASEQLVPPLALRWEYDATAGFAPYSAAVADSIVFAAQVADEQIGRAHV